MTLLALWPMALYRRLHLRRNVRRIEAALKVNQQRINRLLSHINFDNNRAAELRERYLKSPTLQMRRMEDQRLLQQLCEERTRLLRQLQSHRS